METKYKVWDVERKSYWPEQFTLIELAASRRFPSNAAQFYVIEPVTPAPDAALVEALRNLLAYVDRQTDYPPGAVREPMAVKQARAALASVEQAN